ncbi:MAG: hypothetical protein AB1742_15935, partial [bacterium]
FFAVTCGWIGTPWKNRFHELVNFTPFQPAAAEHAAGSAHETLHAAAAHAPAVHYDVMIISSLIALAGILIAALVYHYRIVSREKIRSSLRPIHTLLTNKYYMDEIAAFLFLRCGFIFISALKWFDNNVVDGLVNLVGWLGVVWSAIEGWTDKWIVDGLVNLVGAAVRAAGAAARRFQTGYLQNYALAVLIGVLLILLLK